MPMSLNNYLTMIKLVLLTLLLAFLTTRIYGMSSVHEMVSPFMPTTFEGQMAAAVGGGCAIGFVMGPKGCVVGAGVGAGVVLYHSNFWIQDPDGINVCIAPSEATYHAKGAIAPMWCPSPNYWVYLKTVESLEIPMSLKTVDGSVVNTKIVVSFKAIIRNRVSLLNRPSFRERLLETFYEDGKSLQFTVLQEPFTECLMNHSELEMTSNQWKTALGHQLGEEIRPQINECLSKRGLLHQIEGRALKFKGIHVTQDVSSDEEAVCGRFGCSSEFEDEAPIKRARFA